MKEEFKKYFPVANEGEIRTFFFRRVWYATQLKYAINDSSHEPVHMSKYENDVWKFEHKMTIVPIYLHILETDFAKAIEQNESE